LGNEIVKEYLRKYRQSPSLSIAKLLFKEHPELFKNVEQARTMVRYYRGAKGEAARAKLPESRIPSKISSLFTDVFFSESFCRIILRSSIVPPHSRQCCRMVFNGESNSLMASLIVISFIKLFLQILFKLIGCHVCF